MTKASAPISILLTCEHAGNRIPREVQHSFVAHKALLRTHRGYDIGALGLAKSLARRLRAPLLFTTVSRLVVECNRSLHHPKLFWTITRPLPASLRQKLLDAHYFPHRLQVESAIQREIQRGRLVVHIGVHTFTPMLNGVPRHADIGLLYDPRRAREKTLCDAWRHEAQSRQGDLVVRRNYPYLGISDGFTTSLRRKFPERQYLGIELEVNQQHFLRPTALSRVLPTVIAGSLVHAVTLTRERLVEMADRQQTTRRKRMA